MSIINYAEFRKRQYAHFLCRYEIPTEYFISLPMPTKRFGAPAYALFASPSSMHPGKPVSVDIPQMWWAMDAQTEKILLFAQTKILPVSKQKLEPCTLPKIERTLDEQETLLKTLESQLTDVSNLFFQNGSVDGNLQFALKETLHAYLPEVIFPFYQAISPDFFDWLK